MGEIVQHRFENGLTLLLEPLPSVASVSMSMLLPAGASSQPVDRLGIAAILAEMIMRGAGGRNSRQHTEALEQLGIRRSTDVRSLFFKLDATCLTDKLDAGLPLLLDMIRAPHLDEKEFEPARELAIQDIESLTDNPQQRVIYELQRLHQPDPLNRLPIGTLDGLAACSIEDVRDFHEKQFKPDGSVLAFAGAIDPQQIIDQVGTLLGSMTGSAAPPEPNSDFPAGSTTHLTQPATQQHIGLAYTTIPESHPDAILQKSAIAILSGGMSGRLFTEVREKRGLCYSVYATFVPYLQHGVVYAYAGTTTERASETLAVLTDELHRLAEGVDADEFERAIVGMKSRVIMQGESTAARATAIASDHVLLGQPRTLDELATAIDCVTRDDLNAFVASHPPQGLTTVTIGPEPIANAECSS